MTDYNPQPLIAYLIGCGGFEAQELTWPQIAEKFGAANQDAASARWYRFLKTKKGIEFRERNSLDSNGIPYASREESGGTIRTETYSERPITPEEQARFHKIDLNIYEAGDMKTNYWEVDMKVKVPRLDSEGKTIIVEEPINRPLHQLTVKWVKKKVSSGDYQILMDELNRSFTPKSFVSKKPEPGEHKTYLVLPDVHRPYHNKFLWDAVLHLSQDIRPHGVVILGDYLDVSSIASYNKGKVVKYSLWDEYQDGAFGIRELESTSDFSEKDYLNGNHEFRLYNYMKDLEVSKLGQAVIGIERGLGLEGWNYLNNWKEDYVQLGGLQIIHGEKTGKQSLDRTLADAETIGFDLMYGHTHWFMSKQDNRGAVWNIGTLADLDSVDGFGYVSRFQRANWRNGFALVVVDDENRHFVTPVKCTNRNFFLFGKKY